MNQTRTFLMFALFAVGYFLFLAWQKDYAPLPPSTPIASSSTAGTQADGSVPVAANDSASAAIPSASPPAAAPAPTATAAQLISISTDVLHLTVDTRGGSVVKTQLLAYPSLPPTHAMPHPAPTVLLDNSEDDYFVAQNGLVSSP
jgi:YidC/Oxa1 family membrane protein insertase